MDSAVSRASCYLVRSEGKGLVRQALVGRSVDRSDGRLKAGLVLRSNRTAATCSVLCDRIAYDAAHRRSRSCGAG